MKKYYAIAIVATFMLFTGKANAQFGIHAGYQNSTCYSILQGNGFYVGGSFNIKVVDNFGIAPCLLFSYTTYSFIETASLVDVRFPLLATYTININKDLRVFGFAGPMADCVLDGGKLFPNFGPMFGGGIRHKRISIETGYSIDILSNDVAELKQNHFCIGLGYSF